MHAFQNAMKLALTSILALTFTLAEFGKEPVKALFEERIGNADYAAALALVLFFGFVWILIQLLQEILPWYVQRNVWLRRALLREDFIEGIWKDVVLPDGEGLHATGGIVKITYTDGSLNVSGESFDAAGNPIGNFKSLVTHYDKNQLVYCFSKNVSRGADRPVSPGYCDYRFHASRRYPDSFVGYFFKEDDHAKYRVQGFRLTTAEEAAVRRGPAATGAVVRELIAKSVPPGAAVTHLA